MLSMRAPPALSAITPDRAAFAAAVDRRGRGAGFPFISFVEQLLNGGADRQVGDMAETVEAQAPLPVDQQQAGSAGQAIARHGHRNAGRIIMAIDRDRPDAAIFVHEEIGRTSCRERVWQYG